jgi:hypothetical protein
MSKKRKPAGPGHTPLKGHKKVGASLIPPLGGLNVKAIPWDRDLLPEFLWAAALRDLVSPKDLHRPFYAFMDAVDEFWQEPSPAIGLLSDFGVLAKQKEAFLAKHAGLVHDLFLEPFGRMLAFFPDSPASWLVADEFLKEGGPLDPAQELPRLGRLVVDMIDGRGELATAARMAVFGRTLKGGKLFFPRGMETLDLLPRYPDQCSDDERRLVESFVRATQNAYIIAQDRYRSMGWSAYFWRHNADLVACKPHYLALHGARAVSADGFERLQKRVLANTQATRAYLRALSLQIPYDLYAPERGEILHGLFARCVRLYLLISENPPLWARDVSGILLRCLVETAITLSYLAEKGTDDDFRRFREYGEAQRKLLMLHLQDSYPGKASLDGRSAGDLSEELGGFGAELIQIDLGHWSKQDARRLAEAVGLSEYYRLVFSPTSADVHGTWASLKDSNLCFCGEPLHRFHRMPTYAEPPLYVETLEAAQALLLHAHRVGVKLLGYAGNLKLQSLLGETREQEPGGQIGPPAG